MIVRRLTDIENGPQDVRTDTFASRRFLLQADGMGFSLHDTVLFAGSETKIWYKHHLEAVYCIEGEGELELEASGEIFAITPGTMYALDGHESHRLRAKSNLRVVCVFNPPLTGREIHQADGSYPPATAPSNE